jgi:hypothetical protein
VGTTGGLPHRAVTVTVREAPGLRDPATTAAQTVDVDGRKAAVTGNSVAWRAGDGNVIEVATGVPMAPADLLRIARSMRVDGTAYAPPLVLGWAPAGWRDVAYEQSGDSGIDWNATAVLSDPDRPAARITVTLAPSTSTISAPPADAEIVDVGGRPAELSTRRGPDGQAVLDLVQRQENSAYQLTVSGPARDDLIRIAQQVSPSKEFDADWLD